MILENQIKSYAGFVDEHLEVLDKNFMSYVDYSDNQFSTIQAELERLKYFESLVYSWTEDVEKLTSMMTFNHDCLEYDYYRHLLGYKHIDSEGKMVQPEPILERDLRLNKLKDSIEERSRKYGIPMGAQFYRHREEKPE